MNFFPIYGQMEGLGGHITLLSMEAVKSGFEFFYFETLDNLNIVCIEQAQFIVDLVDPEHGPLQRTNVFRQRDEECATCAMHYMEVRARVRMAEPAGMVRGLVHERYNQIRSALGSCMTNLSKARVLWLQKEKESEEKQEKLQLLLAETKSLAEVEAKKLKAVSAEYAETASAFSSAGIGLPDFPLPLSSAELRQQVKAAAKAQGKAKAKPVAAEKKAAAKGKAKAEAKAKPKAGAAKAAAEASVELSEEEGSLPSDSEMVAFKALQKGEEPPENWTPPIERVESPSEPPDLPPPAEEPPELETEPIELAEETSEAASVLPPAEEPPQVETEPIELPEVWTPPIELPKELSEAASVPPSENKSSGLLPLIYPLEPHENDDKDKSPQVVLTLNFLKKYSEEELLQEMHALREHSSNGQLLNGLMMVEHVRTREGIRKCSACRFSHGCTRCSFPHAMRYVLAHSHAANWWNKMSGKAMKEIAWASWGCLIMFV